MRKPPRKPRRAKLTDAALAIASDGTLIANAAHRHPSSDPHALVDAALADGAELFVGIALREAATRRVRVHLEESAAEAVATLLDE
jgi:hypothetical protein